MDTVYYDKDLCVFIIHAEQETPFNVGYDSLEVFFAWSGNMCLPSHKTVLGIGPVPACEGDCAQFFLKYRYCWNTVFVGLTPLVPYNQNILG